MRVTRATTRRFVGQLGLVALVAAAFTPIATLTTPDTAWASPQTFNYTGAPQLYVVPDGITSITVTASGAQGVAPGTSTAGRGATVSATISVSPGETLQINVGGSGSHGGWNGGGTGVTTAGGATDIRRPAFSTSSSCAFNLNCALSQRVVVAGGGGSGASFTVGATTYTANGGDAGLIGSAGTFTNWSSGSLTSGGGGGTASAGGTSPAGGAGSLGVGGTSGYAAGGLVGGNGGGGYYGGGAGGQTVDGSNVPNAFAGGGGGSSYYAGAGVSAGSVTGFNSGDGVVTVSVASAIGNAAIAFTGTPQFYTVPATITQMYVKIYGGSGGGIQGDTVSGRLPVTSGQVLQVNLGGRGWGPTADQGFTAYAGGWNGGGNGAAGGGSANSTGGGGASDIRICTAPQTTPCALADRVVVAGGGGGSWEPGWGFVGGVGGSVANGSGGSATNPHGKAQFPEGGTLVAAGRGADGSGWVPALDGALGQGGSTTNAGGGGGGGYYGGGAGETFGGGGGSSYASVTGAGGSSVLGVTGAAFQHARGGASGDGLMIITAMPQAVTTSATVSSSSAANITGTVNPRYLATTPTVFYGTSQSAVEQNSSSSQAITGPNSASTLAGSSVQQVSGGLTGLSAGTTYYYTVCAQSVAGYGCGAVQSFATPAAGAPIWVNQDSSGSAALGSAFASYTFQASGNTPMSYSVSSGALPAGLNLNSSSGVLSGTPTAGGTFSFSVTATNGVGTAVSVLNTITVSGGAPSAPSVSQVNPGGGQVAVSWTPPGSNGGSVVTGYTVTASNGMTCSAAPPATACVVTGLTPGTQYTFTVTATNAIGTSVASSVSSSVMPLSSPNMPSSPPVTSSMLTLSLGISTSTSAQVGDPVLIEGTGFAPNSMVDVYVYSTPTYAGTGAVNANGSFSFTVALPAGLANGPHTVVAAGFDPQGAQKYASAPIWVGDLASAGANLSPITIALVAFGLGGIALFIGSRRRPHSRSRKH